MRLLLDTHVLLWWFSDDPGLPVSVRRLIANADNEVFVSAVSAWEIATKVGLGRLPGAAGIVDHFEDYLQQARFQSLSISSEHGLRAGSLKGSHKDPFDRMLAAQAQAEQLKVVSNDRMLEGLGVGRVW
jgi:PIN domain nuclease of toxin-antitoxin system